jgi:hypothetical protein
MRKKIWWDIRLHPFFDTLEIRICDAQSRVDDTLALDRSHPGGGGQVAQADSTTISPSGFIGAA